MALKPVTKTQIPTRYGMFTLIDFDAAEQHLALVYGEPTGDVLARVHSECLTGEVFGSQRCDCGEQLDTALERIAAEGAGVLVYLRQEGRGIGLANKLKAYALQDAGMDTVEANHALGFADDARDFMPAVEIFRALGVTSVRLMTNNPRKILALEQNGIAVTRVALFSCVSADNAGYLKTKADKLGHIIPAEILSPRQKNRA
jgi:GTP cyclohydrolase II